MRKSAKGIASVALLKKWVAALRSGKYRQGLRFLKQKRARWSKPRHCALGVLCEEHPAARRGWLAVYRDNPVIDGHAVFDNSKVRAALTTAFPGHTRSDGSSLMSERFVVFNDELGHSFKKIAKHIEDNFIKGRP